jgi:Methyltransferase domain
VTACKICGYENSVFFGVVPQNRAPQGPPVGDNAEPATYRCCPACGFVWTSDFDTWMPERWAADVYNTDYPLADPESVTARPAKQAAVLIDMFRGVERELNLIDYGGGQGKLAGLLRAAGWLNATSYDPIADRTSPPPSRRFDVVCAFEVFEHSPNPHALVATLAALMDEPNAMLILTTLLRPRDAGPDWWYIAPRIGHVSIFSPNALECLMLSAGLDCTTISEGTHIAWRKPPKWNLRWLRHENERIDP